MVGAVDKYKSFGIGSGVIDRICPVVHFQPSEVKNISIVRAVHAIVVSATSQSDRTTIKLSVDGSDGVKCLDVKAKVLQRLCRTMVRYIKQMCGHDSLAAATMTCQPDPA